MLMSIMFKNVIRTMYTLYCCTNRIHISKVPSIGECSELGKGPLAYEATQREQGVYRTLSRVAPQRSSLLSQFRGSAKQTGIPLPFLRSWLFASLCMRLSVLCSVVDIVQ